MILLMVSVSVFIADARTDSLSSLRAALGFVATPFQELVTTPRRLAQWLSSRAISNPVLRDELDELRRSNLMLRVRQQKVDALEAENQRLRRLLSVTRKELDRVMLAELVDASLEPYPQTVLIDKGTLNEVYEGQPVLDAEGVIGQVVRASRVRSRVALITDAGQTIPAMVKRNGLRVLVAGMGVSGGLDVPYLDRNADIRKNDLLITSGMGGRFPHGYPVAVVGEVAVDVNEPFLQVTAAPVARPDHSREVLLVWPETLPASESGNGHGSVAAASIAGAVGRPAVAEPAVTEPNVAEQ